MGLTFHSERQFYKLHVHKHLFLCFDQEILNTVIYRITVKTGKIDCWKMLSVVEKELKE